MVIAVTGASGLLAHGILAELAKFRSPGERVVACSRNPERLGRDGQIFDEARRADFADPASMQAAFRGIDTLVLVSIEGPDEERIDLHRKAVEAAAHVGVKRIVYTSFFDVDPASPSMVAHVHRETELAVMASGCRWVMLRNGPYIDNIARRMADAARHKAAFRMSAGTARLPFISRADLAVAAAYAAADQNDKSVNVAYRLSGQALLSCNEVADLVANVTGLPVRYEAVDDAAHGRDLVDQGLTPELISRRLAYSSAMRGGFMTALTGDFCRLTARDPHRIADILGMLDLSPGAH